MSEEAKLYRCMGRPHCKHIPGTCTATNTEYQKRIKQSVVSLPATSTPVVDHETGNMSDKVTQADRELLIRIMGYDSETIDVILAGNAFTWEVEQIARHRQSTRAALVAEIVAWLRADDMVWAIIANGDQYALATELEAKWGKPVSE